MRNRRWWLPIRGVRADRTGRRATSTITPEPDSHSKDEAQAQNSWSTRHLVAGHAYADTGSCCLRTFKVLNNVLRLIPNMEVNSLTGSPCSYKRSKRF